jgi:hypothetical protein
VPRDQDLAADEEARRQQGGGDGEGEVEGQGTILGGGGAEGAR